ncbi:MAG: PEP-CTERM sorting domain-containing protein [Pirellulaceae bacterium]|nr:PEP-CTERM sorting domain-containing protein [Pirellulaceae bacterium]
MMYKPIALTLAVLALAMLPAGAANAIEYGDPLVGNVFVTGFDGWTDQYYQHGSAGGGLPNWGVLLTDTQALSESSDGRAGTGATRDGQYKPYIMVNEGYTTPAIYTISATMGSWDDDGFGLVFGYVDNDNYCRIGFREQNSGSLGFPEGASLQTIVNGVITYVQSQDWYDTSGGWPPFDGTMMNVVLSVDGTTGAYTVTVDGTQVLGRTNTNLIGKTEGAYGVHAWYQMQDTAISKQQGLLVKDITIASGAFNKTTTFADVIAAKWRGLNMTNAKGFDLWGLDEDNSNAGEDYGNFCQDFRNGTIRDDSNAYDWATVNAPNIDFIGAAVVVDEPGNATWSDYEMTVRVACGDNEGPGVLVRVQDDDTFYRVNFASEAIGIGENRAPRGMSIQKCKDGVWSELFREGQLDGEQAFLYGDDVPFDLKVSVIGNAITVSVVNDPEGAAAAINYATVYDTTNPILTGSVGLTNWGAGDADNGLVFSAYGGIEGHALVTYIPEPSMLMLLGLVGVCSLAVRRRA